MMSEEALVVILAIDQIKAEQSWDEPCSTHGIFAYGRGAGRQALCMGVGTKWLGMGQLQLLNFALLETEEKHIKSGSFI